MIKRFLRELYLLPRGEQRAVIMVSMLLMLSVLIRIWVQLLPGRDPPGMEEFVHESRILLMDLAEADQSTFRSPGKPIYSGMSIPDRPQIPPIPVDINRADSLQLLPLPGIGPVLAGRIIKYRNLLGGYISTDQMEEVYGLKREIIDQISDLIMIDTTAIRKIHIDSADFRELLRHPYFEMEDVKVLMKYRDFTGHIQSITELREQQLLNDSTLSRVSSYLKFSD